MTQERKRASSGGKVLASVRGDEFIADLIEFPDRVRRLYIMDLTRYGIELTLEGPDINKLKTLLRTGREDAGDS